MELSFLTVAREEDLLLLDLLLRVDLSFLSGLSSHRSEFSEWAEMFCGSLLYFCFNVSAIYVDQNVYVGKEISKVNILGIGLTYTWDIVFWIVL